MSRKIRILFADGLDERAARELEERREIFDFKICHKISRAELLLRIHEFDALAVRSSTIVDREILEKAIRLQIVVRGGSGLDNIDLKSAAERGITVLNTPDEGSDTTAEHTIGLLIAAARRIPQGNESLKQGQWDRSLLGTELAGKTLGILGLGRIGRRVAKRLQAFEMKVVAYDPYIDKAIAEERGVELIKEWEVFLKAFDVLSLHLPYDTQTHHMIDERALSKMRPGVLIVNCARGGIISEKAILQSLNEGHVLTFATDVFESEPPKSQVATELLSHPRVVATPHLGARTVEAQRKIGAATVELLINFFESKDRDRESEEAEASKVANE